MEIELHRGKHQPEAYWDLRVSGHVAEPLPADDVLLDEVLREWTAGVWFPDCPSIECRCGRRWWGSLDPPQILEEPKPSRRW